MDSPHPLTEEPNPHPDFEDSMSEDQTTQTMQLSMEVDQDEFEYPMPVIERSQEVPTEDHLPSTNSTHLVDHAESSGLAIASVASADLTTSEGTEESIPLDVGHTDMPEPESKGEITDSDTTGHNLEIVSEISLKPTPNAEQSLSEAPSNGTDEVQEMPVIVSVAPEINMAVLEDPDERAKEEDKSTDEPTEGSNTESGEAKSPNVQEANSEPLKKDEIKENVSMGILEVSPEGKLSEPSEESSTKKKSENLNFHAKPNEKSLVDNLTVDQPHLACTSELVVVKQEHLDEDEDGSGHIMGSSMIADFARFNELASNTTTSLLQRETDDDLTNYTKTCLLKSHHTDIRFVVRKTRGLMSDFITVQAHSLVLCQYSALIAQMVQQVQCPCHFSPCYHPQPSLDIFLPDFPVAVFRDLLSLCYTGSVGVCTQHRFMDISELANVLQIDLAGVSFVDVDRKSIVRWPRSAGTPTSSTRSMQSQNYAHESPRETPSPMAGPVAMTNGSTPFNDRCYICFSGFDSASKLRSHLVGHFASEIKARYPLSKDVCELCGRGVSYPASHIALKHGVLFDFVTYEKQPSIFTCHFVKYRKPPLSGTRPNELGPGPEPEYPEPTPMAAPAASNIGVGSGNYVRKSKRKRKGKWLHVPDEHIPESLRDREGEIEMLGTDDFM